MVPPGSSILSTSGHGNLYTRVCENCEQRHSLLSFDPERPYFFVYNSMARTNHRPLSTARRLGNAGEHRDTGGTVNISAITGTVSTFPNEFTYLLNDVCIKELVHTFHV